MKAADRKRRTEDSDHIQESEIIDNRNVHSYFKVTSGTRTIKTTWWNHGEIRFPKIETLLYILTSQTIHFSNLDDAEYHLTSQSSEKIDFYCAHEEADTKMFAYENIRPNRIIFVLSDTDVTVISLH